MKRRASTPPIALAIVAAALATAPASLAKGHRNGCDRGTIVFTRSGPDGIPNLWATDPCGAVARPVTTTGAAHPDLSADGRRVAYDSIPDGEQTTDVFVAAVDGSGARNVTHAPARSDIQPDLSPNGRAVAYSSGTSGRRDAQIFVRDLRSGDARAVTPVIPGQEAFDPSWSPSGRWIAFDTFDGPAGMSRLWVVRSDGEGLRQITDDAADACQPDWGPTGLIAYTGDCDQAQSHLFVRDRAGHFVRQLTTDLDGGSSQLPAFSPDGRSLTFSRFDAAFSDGDIWRLDLDSGDSQVNLVSGPTFDLWPVWGPALNPLRHGS